jgi:hypothetical protein
MHFILDPNMSIWQMLVLCAKQMLVGIIVVGAMTSIGYGVMYVLGVLERRK